MPHAAGDEALRRVATPLAESVRPGDVVDRCRGEEFCALLAETSEDTVAEVAERVRERVCAAG
ncbi:MAG: diguanylate cyclase domain-containing protein [Acidimicrobiales bacterium]